MLRAARPDPRAHRRALPVVLGIDLIVALAAIATTDACAQALGGAFGLASDNVYRGVSLADGRPGWFADLHADFGSRWVAGVGASSVEPRYRPSNTQLTLYLDRRWQIDEDWAAKMGVIHYDAARRITRPELRYDELNAAIGFRGRWRALIAWSPNASGLYADPHTARSSSAWLESSFHQPVFADLSADLGIGFADPGGPARNYRYASFGLNARVGDVYTYLTRIWTSPLTRSYAIGPVYYEYTTPTREEWVGAIVWSF